MPKRPRHLFQRKPLRWALLGLLLCWAASLQGQTSVTVRIVPTYAGAPLALDTAYPLPGGDSIRIQTLRFYLSGLQAWAQDLDDPGSLSLSLSIPAGAQPDAISFQLGIDSTTNVSGALGGDLDPVLGMYWAWQSGYINFKLEGSSPLCPTRHHAFQYHLGGYLPPFAALQNIRLSLPPAAQGRTELVVGLAIDRFLAGIDLRTTHTVMRPCAEAVALSELLASLFYIL
jgi:hypothetical protein